MGQSQSHNKVKQHQGYFNPEYEVVRIVDDMIYGRVKHVKEKNSKNVYLLKELGFNENKFFNEELDLLKAKVSFDHPNIVKMIGYNVLESQQLCSKMLKIFIFIEKLENDLDSELRERIANEDAYTENDLLFIAENMTSLLYNLQMRNMNHGDIRPFNIFYSEKDQVYKLVDPQLEADRHANGLTKAIIHHAETFLAPEVLGLVPKRKVEHSQDKYKMDVFSLGATLLGLATLTHSEELFDYKAGTLNEDLLNERLKRVQDMYSSFTYELILDMLTYDDYNRPNFIDIEDRLLPYHEVIRHKKTLPFKKDTGCAPSIEEVRSTNMPPIYEVEERQAATSKASAIQAKPLDSIEILSEEPPEVEDEEERFSSALRIPDKKEELVTSSGFVDEEPDCEIPDPEPEPDEIESTSSVNHWKSRNEVEAEDDLEMKIQKALQRTQATYRQVEEVDCLPVFERKPTEEYEEEDIITRHRREQKERLQNNLESETLVKAHVIDKDHKIDSKPDDVDQEEEVERRNFISFGVPDPDVSALKKYEESVKATQVSVSVAVAQQAQQDADLLRAKEIEEIVKTYLRPTSTPTPTPASDLVENSASSLNKPSISKKLDFGAYALEEGSVSLKASSDFKDLYSGSSYKPFELKSAQGYYSIDQPYSSEVVSASSTSNYYGFPPSLHHEKVHDYSTPLDQYSYLQQQSLRKLNL